MIRRLLVVTTAAVLTGLAMNVPAHAAHYRLHIHNSAREDIRVHFKGLKCMAGVPAAMTIADLDTQTFPLETQQTGKCAVLHEPSELEFTLSGGQGRHFTGVLEKYPLLGWVLRQRGFHGLRVEFGSNMNVNVLATRY